MIECENKAGLKVGNTLVQINDWKIEAMESTDVSFIEHVLVMSSKDRFVPSLHHDHDDDQVALNVLLAAGFYLTLSWINTSLPLASNVHDCVF